MANPTTNAAIFNFRFGREFLNLVGQFSDKFSLFFDNHADAKGVADHDGRENGGDGEKR